MYPCSPVFKRVEEDIITFWLEFHLVFSKHLTVLMYFSLQCSGSAGVLNKAVTSNRVFWISIPSSLLLAFLSVVAMAPLGWCREQCWHPWLSSDCKSPRSLCQHKASPALPFCSYKPCLCPASYCLPVFGVLLAFCKLILTLTEFVAVFWSRSLVSSLPSMRSNSKKTTPTTYKTHSGVFLNMSSIFVFECSQQNHIPLLNFPLVSLC